MPRPSFSFRSSAFFYAALRLSFLAAAGCCALVGPSRAETISWSSPLLGRSLGLELLEPTGAGSMPSPALRPAVFYFLGLAAPRVGTESDDTILRDLRAGGYFVVCLDYARDPRAHPAALAREFVALRHAFQQRSLLANRSLDPNHLYFLPAGCRLRRDVTFYRDEKRILAMDLIYPSRPTHPVGAVLEFSCDNRDRMGNFSLDFCTDALLPCAAAAGFAVAMADHPVAPPYAGLDPMPDSARKIKAAVRTLRAQGVDGALPLNGRIVPAGFSRGSGMALMLATTMDQPAFDGFGEHPHGDSRVQGAVVMSGRFTYLDLPPGDDMIPRYIKAWGDPVIHREVWRAHGALDYLQRPTVPLFVTVNLGEQPALHQMEALRQRLSSLQSPFTYQPETEARGHRMPLDPAVLQALLDYLESQLRLDPAPVASLVSPVSAPAKP